MTSSFKADAILEIKILLSLKTLVVINELFIMFKNDFKMKKIHYNNINDD